jgi:superfamily II DNA or RNA helicase
MIEYMTTLGFPIAHTRNKKDLKNVIDFCIYYPEDEPLDSSLKNNISKSIKSKYKLNPYKKQVVILDSIKKYFKIPQNERGKLILPPGIGKSYISAFYMREMAFHSKILILVPLRSIKGDFLKVIKDCEVKATVDIKVYNTARNDIELEEDEKKFTNDEYDLIVYDEAHHFCASKNSKLLDIKARRKLFLTATERIYEDDNHILSMDNRDVFGNYIYSMNISDALMNNLLCDYKILMCDWTRATKGLLDQLCNVYHRKKIIMLFNTVEKSKTTKQEIQELKYNVYHLDADTSLNEREVRIREFIESAEPSIICSVNVIGEGVNIPCIDTVIFMESRSSNIGVIQNIGRGLRKTPEKDFCIIVVPEEMLKNKFLYNLRTYDERWRNPRGMLICLSDVANRRKGEDYHPDKIVKLIEVYDSRNKTEEFKKRLRQQAIYCYADYEAKYRDRFDDYYIKWPEDENIYPGFNWDELPVYPNGTYTYEECEDAIAVLLEDEKIYEQLRKIENNESKMSFLYRIDNRVKISIYGQIANSNNEKIRAIFRKSLIYRLR